MQSRPVHRLALKLRSEYRLLRSWSSAAQACSVLTSDGRPNPGLAWRIAHGYEPHTLDLRQRLGLPGRCPECHRKIKPTVPDWVTRGADFLEAKLKEKGTF